MTPEQYQQTVKDSQDLIVEFDDRMLMLQAQLEYRRQLIKDPNRDLEELAMVEHWISRNHRWVVIMAEQYNKAMLLMAVPEERINEIIHQIQQLKEQT